MLTTYQKGGRVITNKNTYFAHLHKGKRYGRMYYMSKSVMRACCAYAYNYWVNENRDFFIEFIERFMPVPGWKKDWMDVLWKH